MIFLKHRIIQPIPVFNFCPWKNYCNMWEEQGNQNFTRPPLAAGMPSSDLANIPQIFF